MYSNHHGFHFRCIISRSIWQEHSVYACMLHCVGAEEAMCLGFGSVIASQSELSHEEMSIFREKSVLQSKSYTTTRSCC